MEHCVQSRHDTLIILVISNNNDRKKTTNNFQPRKQILSFIRKLSTILVNQHKLSVCLSKKQLKHVLCLWNETPESKPCFETCQPQRYIISLHSSLQDRLTVFDYQQFSLLFFCWKFLPQVVNLGQLLEKKKKTIPQHNVAFIMYCKMTTLSQLREIFGRGFSLTSIKNLLWFSLFVCFT